jgi:hypothetical protein
VNICNPLVRSNALIIYTYNDFKSSIAHRLKTVGINRYFICTPVPISSIKEIREGNMSDAFSQCNEVFPEERCFSIIHGDSFVALDIVSSSREESMHWLIGLRYLMAKHLGIL